MACRTASRILFLAALIMGGRDAFAQRLSVSATIGVSLHVLPVASFEGGATHSLTVAVSPGVALMVSPLDGVRTRMTYNAPTRVTATTTALRGPDGAAFVPRLLCARSAPAGTLADAAFDCAAGFVALLEGGRATSMALGVGAALNESETRALPAGIYSGQVTLVAALPSY